MDSLEDYVMRCMSDFKPWTFWALQEKIHQKTGKFYGEPTISASIRSLRRDYLREKYDLPRLDEVVIKEKIPEGKGYQYRLSPAVLNHWSNKV